MSRSIFVDYGNHIGFVLLGLPIILFLCMMFVFRPVELNQFSFGKRIQLSFKAMQGEHNFFSKKGLHKLRTYRRLWIVLLVLIFMRLAFGLWLSLITAVAE